MKNRDFTLLCNNCVACGIYSRYGLQYRTPTIGLFFWDDGYIKFLEQPKLWFNPQFKFAYRTRYKELEDWRDETGNYYQIGITGGDIEVHFSHYLTSSQILSAWKRRSQRINMKNIFVIYFDKYDFKAEYYERFRKLPYKKLFFSSNPQLQGEDIVYLPEFKDSPGWCDSWIINRHYEKYVDFTKWFNNQEDYLKC